MVMVYVFTAAIGVRIPAVVVILHIANLYIKTAFIN